MQEHAWPIASKSFRSTFEPLLDALYPPFCVGCGTDGSWFCRSCLTALSPAWSASRENGFLQCHLGSYADPLVRRLITTFKYRSAFCLGGAMREWVRRAGTPPRGLLEGDPVWIPVPTDETRSRSRGGDHALLIAQIVQSATAPQGVVKPVLIRTRKTDANALLPSNEARRGNLRGVIAATEPITRPCVLVDDVFTTGATALACVKALRSVGATDIRVFTLAHG